jgi:hypothetical protein
MCSVKPVAVPLVKYTGGTAPAVAVVALEVTDPNTPVVDTFKVEKEGVAVIEIAGVVPPEDIILPDPVTAVTAGGTVPPTLFI